MTIGLGLYLRRLSVLRGVYGITISGGFSRARQKSSRKKPGLIVVDEMSGA